MKNKPQKNDSKLRKSKGQANVKRHTENVAVSTPTPIDRDICCEETVAGKEPVSAPADLNAHEIPAEVAQDIPQNPLKFESEKWFRQQLKAHGYDPDRLPFSTWPDKFRPIYEEYRRKLWEETAIHPEPEGRETLRRDIESLLRANELADSLERSGGVKNSPVRLNQINEAVALRDRADKLLGIRLAGPIFRDPSNMQTTGELAGFLRELSDELEQRFKANEQTSTPASESSTTVLFSGYHTPKAWCNHWSISPTTWRRLKEALNGENHSISKSKSVRFPLSELQIAGKSEPPVTP